MRILAIETSCDETAISITEAHKGSFNVLSHIVHSQIDVHREYGGVFPTLAKREHGKNLVPALFESLEKADLFEKKQHQDIPPELIDSLSKNPELQESFLKNMGNIQIPEIDYLAVTEGPGLEPALWAGISFAVALHKLWNVPVVPVNHMEGHIASVLLSTKEIEFPALALLVSGGHTELVLAHSWGSYTIIGRTLDDAVGEAFDKVARLMDLPYPGGPEISKLASEHRKKENFSSYFSLPRPMIHTDNFNFSFSGLKTAVRYALEKENDITDEIREKMSREFEDAVTETLIAKVSRALNGHPTKTFILAGGVSANTFLRSSIKEYLKENHPEVYCIIPEQALSTDNATMIALAAYTRIEKGPLEEREIIAKGNLRVDA